MQTANLLALLFSATLLAYSTARVEHVPDSVQNLLLERYRVHSSLLCKTCNVFTAVFSKLINSEEVEEFLEHYLEDHVCPRLPEAEQPDCVADIPKFVPVLVEFLEHIAASQLCVNFGVCQTSDVHEIMLRERLEVMALTKGKESNCKLCKKFAKKVDKMLDSINEDDVDSYKDKFKKACTELPKAYVDKCQSFVSQYSYLLMYFLEKEHREGNIVKMCADINVCDSHEPLAQLPPLQPALLEKIKDTWVSATKPDNCSSCKEIVAKSSGSFLSDDFKEEVHVYFTHLCSHVPPIKESCTTRLSDFAYKFLDFLAGALEPDTFCERFGFCGEKEVAEKIQYALDMCPNSTPILSTA